jgi:hypothetical protein
METRQLWYDRSMDHLPEPPRWLAPVSVLVALILVGVGIGLGLCTYREASRATASLSQRALEYRLGVLEQRLKALEQRSTP